MVKPSDMVINEPVQTRELDSLPIEPEGFQLVEFELVCKYFTLNNIKGTYVHVQDNDVTSSNYWNNMFRKALIDVYLLGGSNIKGCVHS